MYLSLHKFFSSLTWVVFLSAGIFLLGMSSHEEQTYLFYDVNPCRSSHHRCSLKKLFLKFHNIYRKTPVMESLLNKVAGLYQKQTAAMVFSCKYCEIFKNSYFEKHLWTATSEKQDFSDKFIEGRYFLNFIILLIKASSI